MTPESLLATLLVTSVLEELAIPYVIGGSVAASFYGQARLTYDSDIVADILPEHVPSLIASLESDFYVSEIAIQEAIERRSSFNLIHLQTMFKVDIFLPKHAPIRRRSIRAWSTSSAGSMTVSVAQSSVALKTR